MIIKTELELRFPLGASFSKSPSLLLYQRILHTIKRISCMTIDTPCKVCPYQTLCKYFWITGNSFQTFAGVICRPRPFDKQIFAPGEVLKAEFFWIGEAGAYTSLVEYALDNSSQTFFGQPFFIQSIREVPVEKEILEIQRLAITTPLPLPSSVKDSPKDVWFLLETARQEYQDRYGAFFDLPDPAVSMTFHSSIKSDFGLVSLPSRKIPVRGELGMILFEKAVQLDSRWLILGLGKTNCIGGGQIAADHHI